MKKTVTAAALLALAGNLHADTLAERMLAAYDAVETVSCEVRRDTESAQGKSRMLSRVFCQKPDLIHIENVMPSLGTGRRRIVSDGKALYIHEQDEPRGYSRPVSELDADKLIELRRLPGTAMDHLLRLKGVEEQPLPGTPEFPVRAGYQTARNFVVLCADGESRLVQVEFYRTSAMDERIGRYVYSSFSEPLPGVFFAGLIRGEFSDMGLQLTETVRISSLAVNEPVSPMLFVPGAFFENVEFVPDTGAGS